MSAGSWRSFSLLLTVLFLVRGAWILAILPPLEGWDEYQHLAYLVHLDETGTPPVYGRSVVPRSLLQRLSDLPHPYLGAVQLQAVDAPSYARYWRGERGHAATTGAEVGLYQAQHGSFAYRLLLPVYRAAGGLDDPLRTIALLRLVNLGLGAIAILVFLLGLPRILEPRPWLAMAALVAVGNPLLLQNCLRVANDSLAFLLGVGALTIHLGDRGEGGRSRTLVCGLLVGLAVLAKTTNLPLLAGLLIGLGWRNWRRGGPRSAILAAVVLAGAAALPIIPQLVSNLVETGSLLSDKRSVAASQGAGPDLATHLEGLMRLPWAGYLRDRLLRLSLFVGGWSYARLPAWIHDAWAWSLVALGCLTLLGRGRGDGRDFPRFAREFLPILVLMLVGLGTHALLSYVGDGFSAPRSNPWYIAVVFPATALLIHGGTAWLPRRLHLSLGVLAAVFLFAAEVWGHAWVITRVSCAGADPQTTWRRLARLTPDFLGPGLAAPLLGLAVVLFALVLGRALAAAGLAVAPDVPAPGTIPGRPAAS